MSIAYYNGSFSTLGGVRIPLTDRSLFFGDGIYDAAIGRNGKIYMENEHIERFYSNIDFMKIPFSLSKENFARLLNEAVLLSGEDCYFLYFQLSRFSETRKHGVYSNDKSNLLITVTPIEEPDPRKALKLITAEDLRYYYCNVKTLNLLPSVIASAKAESVGFDEAVFHRGSAVTECAHSNISIIKEGEIYTHPTSNLILPGTARAKMLEIALDLGAVCHTVPFTLDDLYSADEVLVTSSTKLCQRASTVDGISFTNAHETLGEAICDRFYQDFIKSTEIFT